MKRTRASAIGPLRSFGSSRSTSGASKGAGGQPAALHCLPSLREGSLRCSVSWPRRRTHYANCVRSVQTTATSQKTRRAARAGHEPCASRLRRGAPPAARPRLCRGTEVLVERKAQWWNSRQGVPGRGDFWSDEQRRLGVGARSALRKLTRRGCLNGASAARVVSSAARPRAEQRSAVGTQCRPLQHEPLPGTPCRDARSSPENDHPTTATGREPPLTVAMLRASRVAHKVVEPRG
jgi:hypothetical protein